MVRGRSAAGGGEFRAYSAGAVTVPGPEAEQLGQIAQAQQVHLVVGVVGRAGSTLYCASVTSTAADV